MSYKYKQHKEVGSFDIQAINVFVINHYAYNLN
jgi:hypothetical protein